MPNRVFCIHCSFTICFTGFMPRSNEIWCNICISKICRFGKIIELFLYPFHPMSTDTCRRFHLKEIAHVWSEYAPVIELLTHRTLLLFVNKSHHRPSVLARRISTMTGCLPLNIPLSYLYACVPVPLILSVVMLLAASLHWQVNDVKNGDHDVLNLRLYLSLWW